MIGKVFGLLTVLSAAPPRMYGGAPAKCWNCQCACGNLHIAVGKGLRSGSTRSCGCTHRNKKRDARFKDSMIGRKFGRLTVLSESAAILAKDGRYYHKWDCKCTCGTTTACLEKTLLNGTKRSCGCLHDEVARRKGKTCSRVVTCSCGKVFNATYGKTKFCSLKCRNHYRSVYASNWTRASMDRIIKYRARKVIDRALPVPGRVQVTLEYLHTLWSNQENQCAVTGVTFEPELRGVAEERNRHRKNPNGPSLDKIDPSLGYTEGNVRWVTNIYNFAKHTFSDSDVLSMARSLVTFRLAEDLPAKKKA